MGSAGLMTREQILQTPLPGSADVDLSDIPGWGLVRVKDLTAGERDRIEQSLVQEKVVFGAGGKKRLKKEVSLENVRAKFVAACVVDEAGAALFNEKDVRELSALNARAIDRLFHVIQERNGLSNADVEELADDFSAGQNDG